MDNVLVGVQFLKPHGASGMHLLGGYAHFASEPEFTSVGESGGYVHVDRRGIHLGSELLSAYFILGYYGLAVAC